MSGYKIYIIQKNMPQKQPSKFDDKMIKKTAFDADEKDLDLEDEDWDLSVMEKAQIQNAMDNEEARRQSLEKHKKALKSMARDFKKEEAAKKKHAESLARLEKLKGKFKLN